MSALITPTTELEAVNECLENIGQSPVSSLAGNLGVDTQIAYNFVRKVNRELQSKGWHWNTEVDYPLEPNGAGDVLLPVNTLYVDSSGDDIHRDVVQRGPRLYDRTNRTYRFTKPIQVEIVTGLSFEELPEAARRYIALRAARIFQDRVEDNVGQTDMQDEADALTELHSQQLRTEDNNMLTGSQTMFNILDRRR